jgi:outer membrane lipoprotein-sorting protein
MPKAEDIITRVWEKAQVQQSKVNDYIRIMHSTVQEKDSTGKLESITQIEKKSYFKKPDKEAQEFVKASKDGKPVSQKDLQPGMLASSFRKPSEELGEQIRKELESILSPSFRDKLDFKLLREEKLEGNNTWLIEATSKSKELKVKKAFIWISQEKMRTVKFQAESIENPSTFVKKIKVSTYLSEVVPGIFLPKANKIEISLSKVSSKQLETTNEFSQYQINAGLPDSLFQKKDKE